MTQMSLHDITNTPSMAFNCLNGDDNTNLRNIEKLKMETWKMTLKRT